MGGGISEGENWVFYQAMGSGWYVDNNGELYDWQLPQGGSWEPTWFSPWGGAAHTRDGKYIVHLPGNRGGGRRSLKRIGEYAESIKTQISNEILESRKFRFGLSRKPNNKSGPDSDMRHRLPQFFDGPVNPLNICRSPHPL